MKNLKNALVLRQLYELKNLGYRYIDLSIVDTTSDEKAVLPNDLSQLNALITQCQLCDISKVRDAVLVGEGSSVADIVFVGFKASMVDSSNKSIVSGNKGEMLKKIITNVLELSAQQVYITNLMKCHPKNDKEIKANEIYSCRTFLYKELEIIKPKIVVTMGVESFNYLTHENVEIEEVRGKSIEHDSFTIVPLYDLIYILKNPSLKKQLYADLLELKRVIDQKC
ncbi:MAG: uracil-DNA glycosylase [Campylobacterota bacterium]|nr:uracil-DNA glycosylase [Campylobacterota bacterium]